MTGIHSKEIRILAIDPSTRGFGFAVLEGANRLIDWGTRSARKNKNDACRKKIADLIDCYQPDILVVENCVVKGSRRCLRVRRLIDAIAKLAGERKIRTRRISRKQVQAAFVETGTSTKHEIATVISKRFPELVPHLPPERKAWMSEDCRERVFGAVGMTLVTFEQRAED